MSILQELYDSEINFRISTFWDGGFEVALGDTMNGFKAETNVDTVSQAEEFLKGTAIEHYHDSVFARRHR